MRGETFRMAVLVTCAAAAIAGAGEPQVAKAYQGGNGERVTVVRRPGGSSEALVKMERTDTRLDGKILKVEITRADSNEDWFTSELTGSRYALITVRRGRYQLHPGAGHDSVDLRYDDKLTGEAKPEEIAAEYQASRRREGGK